MKKKKNNDNKKRKGTVKSYCLSALGMALLLAVALLLPRLVFETQDNYRMNSTRLEKRDTLDIAYINSEYEKSMYERMHYLAGMEKEDIAVSAIRYDGKDEADRKNELQEILSQEWVFRLMEATAYFYGEFYEFPQNLTIRECRKYVVYGNERQNQDRIALMLWYYDLGIMGDADSRIQLLVDSETDSIYYIKLTSGNGFPAAVQSDAATEADFSKDLILQEFQRQLGYHLFFYNEYYEADIDELEKELLEKGVVVVDLPEKEGGNRQESGQQEGDRQGSDQQGNEQWGNDRQGRVVRLLPYGELSLNFLFQADYGTGEKPDIFMGIAEIGNLIPEMMQN